jgi:hypothetical protein
MSKDTAKIVEKLLTIHMPGKSSGALRVPAS